MAKHIENIVIGIPVYPCGELLSDGTMSDMLNETEKTYFTNNPSIAQILKELGVVSSINEVRRNQPLLVPNFDKDYIDCFWVKWGKRKFYVIKGRGVSEVEYNKWRGLYEAN